MAVSSKSIITASMTHPSVTEEVSELGSWHIYLFVCPSGFARVRGGGHCGAQAVRCWLDPVSGTLEELHRGPQAYNRIRGKNSYSGGKNIFP